MLDPTLSNPNSKDNPIAISPNSNTTTTNTSAASRIENNTKILNIKNNSNSLNSTLSLMNSNGTNSGTDNTSPLLAHMNTSLNHSSNSINNSNNKSTTRATTTTTTTTTTTIFNNNNTATSLSVSNGPISLPPISSFDNLIKAAEKHYINKNPNSSDQTSNEKNSNSGNDVNNDQANGNKNSNSSVSSVVDRDLESILQQNNVPVTSRELPAPHQMLLQQQQQLHVQHQRQLQVQQLRLNQNHTPINTTTNSLNTSATTSTSTSPTTNNVETPVATTTTVTITPGKVSKPRKKRQCPICKGFFANLTTHKATHLTADERPHRCSICNRGFARNNDLIRHKKRHWKDEIKNNSKKAKSSNSSKTSNSNILSTSNLRVNSGGSNTSTSTVTPTPTPTPSTLESLQNTISQNVPIINPDNNNDINNTITSNNKSNINLNTNPNNEFNNNVNLTPNTNTNTPLHHNEINQSQFLDTNNILNSNINNYTSNSISSKNVNITGNNVNANTSDQLKSLHNIKGTYKCPYNSTLVKLDMEMYPFKAKSLNFQTLNCHQTGVFSRCDTFKNHLKALHFEYPQGTKRKDRLFSSGKCKHCGQNFPNVDVWLNYHVGKNCGYTYH
ncbi:hypothetical protein TBLA_0I02770 [Henningerozyma blattae CBS 6284]|uniref:C2H2-type domain-containing protein n=1 Tax=Henningerozyma blattae (strain ATCC 34711 / CBS 6284 / DSM 70876 / NBRC 10599 / NRRL Y-10934 / UCD 77-7) TaxID=1071380 RepID=I2H981_HENB6|nr:hypothetical protein TBLA_0I02770 [Tetrapisispora blattae CBS 6284]CCH62933.1 hypothetical protein TBLA_0I02770 [Tetrapisispora blattae CBS 6284]